MAERPFYGGIPKVVDSQMVQKMRKKGEVELQVVPAVRGSLSETLNFRSEQR
jgi:hypothetical protein